MQDSFPTLDVQGDLRTRLARLLPLYMASFAVIMCALASYASTEPEFGIGPRSMIAVLVGLTVSLFCRLRQWRQNTMFGVMAGMMVLLLFWLSASSGTPFGQFLAYLSNGQNTGPGLMLAWFLVLYSFAMIADEVIIFSIVPSMALLGLMASENPNTEIIVYFLGLVLSAVFLLVYENMLSRGLMEDAQRSDAASVPTWEGSRHYGVRRSLLLSTVVMALALVTGFGANIPLRAVGRTLYDETSKISVPATPGFMQEATNRYINQLELTGAPPRLSDHVVLIAAVDDEALRLPPMYWRGKVFDSYTGNTWTNTRSRSQGEPMQPVENGYVSNRPLNQDANGEAKARQRVVQSFRMEEPPLGGMLVSAGEPQSLWLRRPRFRRTVRPGSPVSSFMVPPPREDRFRGISVLSSRPRLQYRVEGLVSVATPDQLRKAGDVYPPVLKALNTRLDDSYDPSVRRSIALQVTAGKRTAYDKVEALTQYLQDNFTYTLTPPRTPGRQDAVTFFLTSSRQGYCEIFASALAVLCREIGIPARLATGFATGDWDAENKIFRIRERDLHAWTEVYFPGFGWIPFDATSSRTSDGSLTASFRDSFQKLLRTFHLQSGGPLAVIAGILAISVFLLKSYGLDPLFRSSGWRTLLARYNRRMPHTERWALLYERSRRRLRKLAGMAPASQTPYEFADAARACLPPEAQDVFDEITGLYVDRTYRRAGASEDDFRAMEELDRLLRQTLRSPRRTRRTPVQKPA